MFILDTYHVCFPDKIPVNPRERFKTYYRDLHQRYDIDLDESTFVEGSQYKFNELSYPLFDLIKNDNYLQKLDLIVCGYWAHDFDPDYASPLTHLSHYYEFECDMFDVLDQGTLCTLTSLKLIKTYFENNQINTALCYSLDQTTNPRSDRDAIPVSNKNVSSGVIFSKTTDQKNNFEVVDVIQWSEQLLLNIKYDVIEKIISELSNHNILVDECAFFLKRNTAFFKAFSIYKNKYNENFSDPDIRYFPLNLACTDVLLFLDNLINGSYKKSKKYYLYIEEDVESLTTSMLVIKHNQE